MPARCQPKDLQPFLIAPTKDGVSVFLLRVDHPMALVLNPEYLLPVCSMVAIDDFIFVQAGGRAKMAFVWTRVADIRRTGVVLQEFAAMTKTVLEVPSIGGDDRFFTIFSPSSVVRKEPPKDTNQHIRAQRAENPDDITIERVGGQMHALTNRAGERLSRHCSHDDCVAKLERLREEWALARSREAAAEAGGAEEEQAEAA